MKVAQKLWFLAVVALSLHRTAARLSSVEGASDLGGSDNEANNEKRSLLPAIRSRHGLRLEKDVKMVEERKLKSSPSESEQHKPTKPNKTKGHAEPHSKKKDTKDKKHSESDSESDSESESESGSESTSIDLGEVAGKISEGAEYAQKSLSMFTSAPADEDEEDTTDADEESDGGEEESDGGEEESSSGASDYVDDSNNGTSESSNSSAESSETSDSSIAGSGGKAATTSSTVNTVPGNKVGTLSTQGNADGSAITVTFTASVPVGCGNGRCSSGDKSDEDVNNFQYVTAIAYIGRKDRCEPPFQKVLANSRRKEKIHACVSKNSLFGRPITALTIQDFKSCQSGFHLEGTLGKSDGNLNQGKGPPMYLCASKDKSNGDYIKNIQVSDFRPAAFARPVDLAGHDDGNLNFGTGKHGLWISIPDRVAFMKNAPYCGSCYGANTTAHQCCQTCDQIRDAYRKAGWRNDTAIFVSAAQCIREGLSASPTLSPTLMLDTAPRISQYGPPESPSVSPPTLPPTPRPTRLVGYTGTDYVTAIALTNGTCGPAFDYAKDEYGEKVDLNEAVVKAKELNHYLQTVKKIWKDRKKNYPNLEQSSHRGSFIAITALAPKWGNVADSPPVFLCISRNPIFGKPITGIQLVAGGGKCDNAESLYTQNAGLYGDTDGNLNQYDMKNREDSLTRFIRLCYSKDKTLASPIQDVQLVRTKPPESQRPDIVGVDDDGNVMGIRKAFLEKKLLEKCREKMHGAIKAFDDKCDSRNWYVVVGWVEKGCDYHEKSKVDAFNQFRAKAREYAKSVPGMGLWFKISRAPPTPAPTSKPTNFPTAAPIMTTPFPTISSPTNMNANYVTAIKFTTLSFGKKTRPDCKENFEPLGTEGCSLSADNATLIDGLNGFYVWACLSKNPLYGAPITALAVQSNNTCQDGFQLAGTAGKTTGDLNKGEGPPIYLCYSRDEGRGGPMASVTLSDTKPVEAERAVDLGSGDDGNLNFGTGQAGIWFKFYFAPPTQAPTSMPTPFPTPAPIVSTPFPTISSPTSSMNTNYVTALKFTTLHSLNPITLNTTTPDCGENFEQLQTEGGSLSTDDSSLNAGLTGIYIWACLSKNPMYGSPITALTVQSSNVCQDGYQLTGTEGETTGDLNSGEGPPLFLCYTRGENAGSSLESITLSDSKPADTERAFDLLSGDDGNINFGTGQAGRWFKIKRDCGSCYGANTTVQCCNTCEEVVNLYHAHNLVADQSGFVQCEDE
ncbi:reticulum-Golgi intermediate compartment protein 3 [Seminavis robusta]|uniref:Reticulum-Golgi intermediate compartment protein 3 n=1 Tax=Seminavis robusta TaxID=568900 RepID=A0A9N8EKN3_9STRA|nr:reticulum-Golgi intermediate compartment protein 3 [Seminavis robusta]|eukprot:Sro1306_g261260.1 reticulum-Golgi intermediate compartment protein 3 (1241) ;mRNA; r:19934-24197